MELGNEPGRNVSAHDGDAVAVDLQARLIERFGRFVLGRAEIAGLLGMSINALKLAELKARGRGERLLPEPVARSAEGHLWSVTQIARWLAGAPLPPAPPLLAAPAPRRRGRPRAEAARVGGGRP